MVPSGVGQINAHQQYRKQFEQTAEYNTPVAIGGRESLMDEMWEARSSAFKVVEERWKTYEKDGKMVSEPGMRRVQDREIETLRRLWQLAGFVATETFDMEIDPKLVLEIEDAETETFDLREVTETEATLV